MRQKQFMARIWSKLMAAERSQKLLSKTDKVLAAVSGGPDSVCLAHYLCFWRRRLGFKLRLLHIHHGLRGLEAERDMVFVQKLGRTLEIPVGVVRVGVLYRAKARHKGIEDAARELRYAALAQTAKSLGFNKVAAGHQMDDQAETVLLQLLRGTRLSALAGMAERRLLAPGILLIRPLLALRKSELIEYLKTFGLHSRLDRSNLSLHYTRNWLRRKIIPEIEKRQPRIREHLAGIARQVHELHL
jgi:tRNA(Ile)-lysidine synthase